MTKKIFKKFFRWLWGSSQIYIRQDNSNYEPTVTYHINEAGAIEIWIEADRKSHEALTPGPREERSERTRAGEETTKIN